MINQQRLVETFCDLARIDSPSGEEEAIAQHLAGRLAGLGFTVERDAHGNVVASEEGHNPLLLSAHMDTVEPGRGVKPLVKGDRIVSDGSTILGGDCKAGLAAILEALASAKEDGAQRRPLQVVFTRGEEIGLVGAANLDYSRILARESVVFDGNGPVNRITGASPTYVSFDVKITGRAAHAGVEPEKGLSAIRIATDLIQQLPQGRLDSETTFNVGKISGGSVRNAVPSDVVVSGEFRSRNIETLDQLRMDLLAALDKTRQKYKEAQIQENLEVLFHMFNLDPNDPLVRQVTGLMRGMNLAPDIRPSGGGTDANVMRHHGINCVVVGMSTNEMHTVNEYVVIPDLMDTARFCQRIIGL